MQQAERVRAYLKVAGLFTGAVLGGPLGAAVGSVAGEIVGGVLGEVLAAAAAPVGIAGGAVFGNLAASSIESNALATHGGSNEHFRRALAMGLQRSLAEVRKDLRDHDTYRVASRGTHEALDAIFKAWDREIEAALKDAVKARTGTPKLLMRLFPEVLQDPRLADLADPEQAAALAHRSAWEALYGQALSPVAEGSGQLPHLPHEADGLRAAVLERLPLRFPAAFAEVVKEREFEASWKAYQKVLLTATLRAVRGLPEEFKAQLEAIEEKLDALASRPVEEAPLNEALLKALSLCQVTLDGIVGNIAELQRLSAERHEDLKREIRGVGKDIKDAVIAGAVRSAAQRLRQLPAQRGFVGRERELDELRDALTRGGVTISGLQGMGGVGKTALALKLAHEFKDRYPDAQIYLDLKGVSPKPLTTAEILWYVISSFEPEQKRPDDDMLPGWYRSLLQERRVLIFYDNAADASQVAPVLPPESCLLLVTSRKRFTLPGMREKNLDRMEREDAAKLAMEIAPRVGEHAEEIARQCGDLPLALCAAASALKVNRTLAVEDYLARLQDQKARLELRDATTALTVEACFSLSYDLLGPELQQRWRSLAVFAGDFDAAAAAAVWSCDADSAREPLAALDAYSLLDWDEKTKRHSLHDLARVFADSRQTPEERATASFRHAAHYANVLALADDAYLKGGDRVVEGLALFDLERANIEFGHEWAARQAGEDDQAAKLCNSYPDAGVHVLELRLFRGEHIQWLEAARRAAAGIGDRLSEGIHLGNLGNAYAALGEVRKAVDYYELALEIAREIGDRRAEGQGLGNLGSAYADLGEVRKAVGYYEQALEISREIGDRRGEGNRLGNLGSAYADLGEVRKAVGYHEQALEISREIGDRRGEGQDLGNLGNAHALLGEVREAVGYYEQALEIAIEIGDRRGEGNRLGNLGRAYAELGEVRKAVGYHEQALEIAQEIGDRRGEANRLANLGRAYASLNDLAKARDLMTQALEIFTQIQSPNADVVRGWLDGLENPQT